MGIFQGVYSSLLMIFNEHLVVGQFLPTVSKERLLSVDTRHEGNVSFPHRRMMVFLLFIIIIWNDFMKRTKGVYVYECGRSFLGSLLWPLFNHFFNPYICGFGISSFLVYTHISLLLELDLFRKGKGIWGDFKIWKVKWSRSSSSSKPPYWLAELGE